MVQGKINRGRHIHHPAGGHSIQTNQCPPPPSPHLWVQWPTKGRRTPQLYSCRSMAFSALRYWLTAYLTYLLDRCSILWQKRRCRLCTVLVAMLRKIHQVQTWMMNMEQHMAVPFCLKSTFYVRNQSTGHNQLTHLLMVSTKYTDTGWCHQKQFRCIMTTAHEAGTSMVNHSGS